MQKTGLLAGAFSVNSLYNISYAADIETANKKIIGLPDEDIATDEDIGV